jgi:hypothetical protein
MRTLTRPKLIAATGVFGISALIGGAAAVTAGMPSDAVPATTTSALAPATGIVGEVTPATGITGDAVLTGIISGDAAPAGTVSGEVVLTSTISGDATPDGVVSGD